MKIKIGRSKEVILLLSLFISLVLNILYLFNIIDFKINIISSKTEELQHKTFKHFIDSPLPNDKIRVLDSMERFKPKIKSSDTLEIKQKY
jgi:hypothetical protein